MPAQKTIGAAGPPNVVLAPFQYTMQLRATIMAWIVWRAPPSLPAQTWTLFASCDPLESVTKQDRKAR
jgi:hypothetical protein